MWQADFNYLLVIVVYLGLFVDVETQLASIEIEEDANCRTDIDPTFCSVTVNVIVEEPGTLMIDIHRPAHLVLT